MSARELADILRGTLAGIRYSRQYLPGDAIVVTRGGAAVRVLEIRRDGTPTPYLATITPQGDAPREVPTAPDTAIRAALAELLLARQTLLSTHPAERVIGEAADRVNAAIDALESTR